MSLFKFSLLFRLCLLLVFLKTSLVGAQELTETVSQANERKCIENIIALDDSLGSIRNHACEKISLSETIVQYTNALARFDYKNCPESFEKAFNAHHNAWLDMLAVTDEYPDLRGELHELFEIIESGKDADQFSLLLKAIWDTWAEVERAMGK